MNQRSPIFLLLCIACLFACTLGYDISAKSIIKAVLAKLPEGNDYTFNNLATTVLKPDGTT